MKVLSSLGIGLSLVFGCLLLALVAEIYYLLWWKKRLVHSDIEGGGGYSCHGSKKDLLSLFYWTKPSSLTSTALNPHEISSEESHSHLQSSKDHLIPKPFDEDEGIEAELMRLHNLTGPPRFLFTIKEETKEDLIESEDGKSRKGRSLSDVLVPVETPFLTPLSSPPFLNPLFESSMISSPPPKFKFLRDAENKLYKKIVKEEALRAGKDVSFKDSANSVTNLTSTNLEEIEGSFLKFLIAKNREKEQHHQHLSSFSQMLPLSSSLQR